MKSVIRRIIDFVFPPKCVACRKLILPNAGYLCDVCSDSYRNARERNCPLCLNPYPICTCPNRYMERHGITVLHKLYSYRAREIELPENKMIYRLKGTSDGRIIKFLAGELAPVIKEGMDENYAYVLVGVPRSKKAIRKNGADHIALLCRELSHLLQIPYIPAVKRVGGASAQKTKGRSERMLSASQSYAPSAKYQVKGKRILLIDDIVTTGASLVACAKVLRRMGARKVSAAVVGCAFRYHELINNTHYYQERRHKYGI